MHGNLDWQPAPVDAMRLLNTMQHATMRIRMREQSPWKIRIAITVDYCMVTVLGDDIVRVISEAWALEKGWRG